MDLNVSVVIPAYNAEKFIASAINSVLAQSVKVHEIIVVDDGSIDSTASVVLGYNGSVKYIHQTNSGVSSARNRGIQESSGDIVAFLDADDIWLPDKVEKQIAVFLRNSTIGVVCTDRQDVDAQGNVLLDSLFRKRGLLDLFTKLDGGEVPNALKLLVHTNFLPTSSVMVMKRALLDVGSFDIAIRYGEDLELWVRIISRYALVCIPEVLVSYRIHNSNVTHHTEKLLLDMTRVTDRICTLNKEALMLQGVDIKEVVSKAYWELGYWYFSSGQPARARKPLWIGFRNNQSLRCLAYAFLCYLPPQTTQALRKFKIRLRANI